MNFRGTFEHSLDAKHRLTVPSKYRAVLSGGVILALSPETERGGARALGIWVPEAYEAYVAGSLAGLNPMSGRARDLSRMLSSNSWDLELDAANRVMIPLLAMQYAGLDKEVTVIGAGGFLEVWDRASHAKYNEALLAGFTDLVESVEHTS